MTIFSNFCGLPLQKGTIVIGILDVIGCLCEFFATKNTIVPYIAYVQIICAVTIGSLIFGAVQVILFLDFS